MEKGPQNGDALTLLKQARLDNVQLHNTIAIDNCGTGNLLDEEKNTLRISAHGQTHGQTLHQNAASLFLQAEMILSVKRVQSVTIYELAIGSEASKIHRTHVDMISSKPGYFDARPHYHDFSIAFQLMVTH